MWFELHQENTKAKEQSKRPSQRVKVKKGKRKKGTQQGSRVSGVMQDTCSQCKKTKESVVIECTMHFPFPKIEFNPISHKISIVHIFS